MLPDWSREIPDHKKNYRSHLRKQDELAVSPGSFVKAGVSVVQKVRLVVLV